MDYTYDYIEWVDPDLLPWDGGSGGWDEGGWDGSGGFDYGGGVDENDASAWDVVWQSSGDGKTQFYCSDSGVCFVASTIASRCDATYFEMPCDCCMLDWDFNIIGYDCTNTDGTSWGECISSSTAEDEEDANAPDYKDMDTEDVDVNQDSYDTEYEETFPSEESMNEPASSTMSTVATNLGHDDTPGAFDNPMPSPDEWQDLFDELSENGSASTTLRFPTNTVIAIPVIVAFVMNIFRCKISH